MSGPYLSVQAYLGMAKELVRGQAQSSNIWLPIDHNPSLTPKPIYLDDLALKGSAGNTYDTVIGPAYNEYDFKGNVFIDTFPNLMMALLGSTDSVTGSAAPYTHVIGLANAPTSGSQPPSYCLMDVDLIEEPIAAAKQMTGGQLSELTLDWAATGALSYTGKFIANPFTQINRTGSAFSTEVFVPGYNSTLTIGSTTNSQLVLSGQIAMKRSAEPIFTSGSANPYQNWAGGIDITGKFDFLALASDGTVSNAINRVHQVCSLAWTDPISSHSVSFQMSQVQFKDPKVERDKPYVHVTTNFVAQLNSTDAVAGGFSPLKFTAVNAQAPAY